jgi:hypothetical protein
VTDLIVERVRAPIPMMPDDLRDFIVTAAHHDHLAIVGQLDELNLPYTVLASVRQHPLPAPASACRAGS